MYKYKISKLRNVKEDGVLIGITIGVTCSKDGQSSYIDWRATKDNFEKFPPTTAELKKHIKERLTQVTNQPEIDQATDEKKTNLSVEIPKAQTRVNTLKSQVDAPVITMEQIELKEEDKTITI